MELVPRCARDRFRAGAQPCRALRARAHRALVSAALVHLGLVLSNVPASAEAAPRLRALLKEAGLVVAGEVAEVAEYDDGRVAALGFAVSTVLKGTPPHGSGGRVALMELRDGSPAPVLAVGQRGIAFLRPVQRTTYVSHALPEQAYYELLPRFGAFAAADSDAELGMQTQILRSLVDASRGRGADPTAARQATFALLRCRSAVMVEAGAAGVADLSAADGLGAEEHETLRAALLRADLSERVRIALVEAIGRAGFGELVPTLQSMESPPALTAAAWRALAQLGAPIDDSALAERLASSDGATRTAALREVLRRDGAAGVPLVEPLALRDPDPSVRLSAVEALGGLGVAEALGPLERVFPDPSPELRQAAARAIVGIGGEAAVATLSRLAANGPIEAQRYAVLVLLTLDTPGQRTAIEHIAATHPDRVARELITDGLQAHDH